MNGPPVPSVVLGPSPFEAHPAGEHLRVTEQRQGETAARLINAEGRRFGRPSQNFSDRRRRHTAVVIHCSSFCLGAAPTWRAASSPFLKIISVGIDMMPYFCATPGFSSTLSLTILTLSPIWPAISSSAGAIMRHGPHHSAQKSTTTGPVALITSASKFASETLPTVMGAPHCWNRDSSPDRSRNVWTPRRS